MANKNQKLVLGQVNSKVKAFASLGNIPPPGQGWINGIRTALNMTLEQLAGKIGISAQSLSEIEKREKGGSVNIKSLKQISKALNMKLVYAILPQQGDLENMIEETAFKKAKEIVNRTTQTMALEDQAVTGTRLEQIIEDKKNELIIEMPKYLWD
jgi:predicted DNA-binding mobile mystery protein A